MKVLIVDDSISMTRNLKKAIETLASFSVDVAYDGEAGELMAQSNNYDLILLDLMLPKVDGMTVLRRLRERGCEKPVLILTATMITKDLIQRIHSYSADCMPKPFDLQELLNKVIALSAGASA